MSWLWKDRSFLLRILSDLGQNLLQVARRVKCFVVPFRIENFENAIVLFCSQIVPTVDFLIGCANENASIGATSTSRNRPNSSYNKLS